MNNCLPARRWCHDRRAAPQAPSAPWPGSPTASATRRTFSSRKSCTSSPRTRSGSSGDSGMIPSGLPCCQCVNAGMSGRYYQICIQSRDMKHEMSFAICKQWRQTATRVSGAKSLNLRGQLWALILITIFFATSSRRHKFKLFHWHAEDVSWTQIIFLIYYLHIHIYSRNIFIHFHLFVSF